MPPKDDGGQAQLNVRIQADVYQAFKRWCADRGIPQSTCTERLVAGFLDLEPLEQFRLLQWLPPAGPPGE